MLLGAESVFRGAVVVSNSDRLGDFPNRLDEFSDVPNGTLLENNAVLNNDPFLDCGSMVDWPNRVDDCPTLGAVLAPNGNDVLDCPAVLKTDFVAEDASELNKG